MSLAFYLLLPFVAGIVFVLGMLFTSKAIRRGASPWTGTLLANLLLGTVWVGTGLSLGEVVPVRFWPQAAVVGGLFVAGQLLTYFAFRFGDVSIATPVFGVKILFVALLSAWVTGSAVQPRVWLAVVMATPGIALIQWSSRHKSRLSEKRVAATVMLAMLAALTLSVFDLLLQRWGTPWGAWRFLPVVFGTAAIGSLIFLPRSNTLSELRELGAFNSMLAGSGLMAVQAMAMCIALSSFGDATRINIVYALRGLWGVLLAWLLARFFEGGEQHASTAEMLRRALGAILLTAAVIIALL